MKGKTAGCKRETKRWIETLQDANTVQVSLYYWYASFYFKGLCPILNTSVGWQQ